MLFLGTVSLYKKIKIHIILNLWKNSDCNCEFNFEEVRIRMNNELLMDKDVLC